MTHWLGLPSSADIFWSLTDCHLPQARREDDIVMMLWNCGASQSQSHRGLYKWACRAKPCEIRWTCFTCNQFLFAVKYSFEEIGRQISQPVKQIMSVRCSSVCSQSTTGKFWSMPMVAFSQPFHLIMQALFSDVHACVCVCVCCTSESKSHLSVSIPGFESKKKSLPDRSQTDYLTWKKHTYIIARSSSGGRNTVSVVKLATALSLAVTYSSFSSANC